MLTKEQLLALLTSPPDERGRYWLVVKDDEGLCGTIGLGLDGSESWETALRKFQDAVVILRKELASHGGHYVCTEHFDGTPRTERERAISSAMKIGTEVGWEGQNYPRGS